MTRRDYIFLAESFRRTLEGEVSLTPGERRGVERAARDMAWAIAQENGRFDQGLFLENAGVIKVTREAVT